MTGGKRRGDYWAPKRGGRGGVSDSLGQPGTAYDTPTTTKPNDCNGDNGYTGFYLLLVQITPAERLNRSPGSLMRVCVPNIVRVIGAINPLTDS